MSLLGRVLESVLKVPEWSRIQRFKLGRGRWQIQFAFFILKDRIRALFSVFVAATAAFWLDSQLYPYLNPSFVGGIFFDETISQEALAAIVGGLSAILGLLVTIYVFAFQMSAERFDATDLMLSFFRNEPVSNLVLDFLTFSTVFSLLTLLAIGVRDFTPYISISFSALAGIISVLLIVVYFRRAIGLTQPSFIFRNIAGEIIKHLDHLARKTTHGPSIENHLRRLVSNQLDLFQEFITVFAGEGPSKHMGIARKETSAAEGMVALLTSLQRFVEMKRFISEKSLWFPRREDPMPSDGTYPRHRYITWAHLSAIGQLPETVIDHGWFEKRLLTFTKRMFTHAVEADISILLATIPMACSDIMLTALDVQEFDILEMVANQVLLPYLERISESDYPGTAHEMYNAIWQIWHALLESDGSEVFLNELPSLPWLKKTRMQRLKLPALFRRDVLELEKMLERENLIAGRRISPDAELVCYCKRHSVAEILQRRQAVFGLLHAFLTSRIKIGIEDKDAAKVANSIQTQMTLVRQVFLRGSYQVYQNIIEEVLENGTSALPILVAGADELPEGLGNLVTEAFHYLVNMIHNRRLDHFKSMLELFTQAFVAHRPGEGEVQHANEQLIILGGLALLFSEYDQQAEPLGSVLEVYQRALHLDNLADLLEVYLRNWMLTQPWIMRYHDHFSPILNEMIDLPEQHHRGPGEIGFTTIPNHPSPIIQRLAMNYAGPPMEGAAYYLYLRICEIIGREPNEEAGHRYS